MLDYETINNLRFSMELPYNSYNCTNISDFIVMNGKAIKEDNLAFLQNQPYYVYSPATKKYWLRETHSETNWKALAKYIHDGNVFLFRRFVYCVVYSQKALSIEDIESNVEKILDYCCVHGLVSVKKATDKVFDCLSGFTNMDLAYCPLLKSPFSLLCTHKKGDRKVELFFSDRLLDIADELRIDITNKFDIEEIVTKYKVK